MDGRDFVYFVYGYIFVFRIFFDMYINRFLMFFVLFWIWTKVWMEGWINILIKRRIYCIFLDIYRYEDKKFGLKFFL